MKRLLIRRALPRRLKATRESPQCMFPAECPTRRAPAARQWDKHPDQTPHGCGTTTLMLAEGFHIENRDPRQEALDKQHLAPGRKMGDSML